MRIVCLSAESADILCRLGAGCHIVGVTAYAALPRSLAKVPRVSGFSSANVKLIIALRPDLVLGYSDVQAAIAAQLVEAGLKVLITHQISLAEIEESILTLGRIVGKERPAVQLAQRFHSALGTRHAPLSHRPRVYFEEWPDPMISGICWVSELIERAGGQDIFPELRSHRRAQPRVVDSAEVVRRNPEVIIASWCGKKVRWEEIRRRPGWDQIEAVRAKRLFEISSTDILQPGPQLVKGYRHLCGILSCLILDESQ